MIHTGIDIGFTEESLKHSKYALCKPYRTRYVGFHADVPEQGIDEFASYRRQYQVINMAQLEHEEPSLFERFTRGEPPLFRQDYLHWYEGLTEKYRLKDDEAKRLKSYIEPQPSPMVLFDKMPPELADEMTEQAAEQLVSVWHDMPYEKHKRICKPCPIRPLEEDNCYIRFSNYPGMNGFRLGFALTAFYSTALNEEKLKQAYFSFPHLDRSKGELPKDKMAELFELCKDAPVNKGAEVVFNNVVDMLEQMKPADMSSDGDKVDTRPLPHIDEFISTYIYRSKPYCLDETRLLLPYFETISEITDWAIWDMDDGRTRKPIMQFKQRFDNLVTALRIADKYELEISMSY